MIMPRVTMIAHRKTTEPQEKGAKDLCSCRDGSTGTAPQAIRVWDTRKGQSKGQNQRSEASLSKTKKTSQQRSQTQGRRKSVVSVRGGTPLEPQGTRTSSGKGVKTAKNGTMCHAFKVK